MIYNQTFLIYVLFQVCASSLNYIKKEGNSDCGAGSSTELGHDHSNVNSLAKCKRACTSSPKCIDLTWNGNHVLIDFYCRLL